MRKSNKVLIAIGVIFLFLLILGFLVEEPKYEYSDFEIVEYVQTNTEMPFPNEIVTVYTKTTDSLEIISYANEIIFNDQAAILMIYFYNDRSKIPSLDSPMNVAIIYDRVENTGYIADYFKNPADQITFKMHNKK